MTRLHTCALLVPLAAAFAHPALAQGDDCTDPLPITVGAYGPFDTTGATTSLPAWPCALGGSDVWFVTQGNANGTATFDTCGSSFDTCIEVLDGACGTLTSLACNDDTCGSRSLVTVNVTNGQLLFVRVGGYNSATGTFVLNATGDLGTPAGFASANGYGTGCYRSRASFFELMSDPANFDLSNTSFTMLASGNGDYTVIGGIAPFVTPTGGATVLSLGDDTSSAQQLTTPFPHAGTTTSSLVAYSNGFVATGSSNATIGTIVAPNFFNEPDAAWRNWHDYDPSAGGQVTFEEIGTTAYFTWTNVPDWNVAGSASTFQFQFDSATGNVTFAFQQMSLTGGGGGGTGHMIGYSPGGVSLQPDELDLSAAIATSFSVQANDAQELRIATDQRPRLGTMIQVETLDVPASATLGIQIFGLNRIDPGMNLAAFFMDGCRQYLSIDASGILLPAGGTAAWPINVPPAVNFAGTEIYAQSLMLVPGVNPFGALTSNGVALRFDIN